MIHDPKILDELSKLDIEEYRGSVFRATRKSLDPLAPSTNGGRWMHRGHAGVLYTSLDQDGALAELTYHWSMMDPLPSKPAVVNRLSVELESTLQILRADFGSFDIIEEKYSALDYVQTQKIGAAVAFLGCHGLIAPSARWDCDNLILFADNLPPTDIISFEEDSEVDWRRWGRENGIL